MVAAPADRDAVDHAVARGSDLLKQGKLDDAQAAFRAALALDADNPRVLALLGLAHFRGNQYERARAIYEELVERLPTDASYRLNLGLVYLKLGDASKAIHSLEASRALDPSAGRAVSYLGLAYARAGRYVEAYRAFLLAGQTELASEIELNLTPAERDGIHTTLARTGFDPRKSSPAIPLSGVTPPAGVPLHSSPAIVIAPVPSDDPNVPRLSTSQMFVLPNRDPNAPRLTESQQFVSPFAAAAAAAAAAPAPGQSAISQAVETAVPALGHAHGNGPVPLSQLATEDLARPDDGDAPFELAPGGALVIRVIERVMTRLDGVHVTGGDLSFERATRHSRGRQTEEKFDYGGSQLHVVTGRGYLIAVPDKRAFTAVSLDDDIFYLREDLVFAFEAKLRWENGNVPGLRGRLPVVQFRGDGAVALRSERPLVRVKLPPQGIVFVDAARLAGWIGRVIPRAVVPASGGPMGDVCVECTGEGVVLIDPVGDPGMQLDVVPREKTMPGIAISRTSTPPPPPPAREAEVDLGNILDEKLDDKPAAAAFTLDDDDVPPGRDEF
jgi:tetratricopeptide (TPR) repeat protein/uncharacterized protein (AIM24 family)